MQDIGDRGRGCEWLQLKRARFASMFKMEGDSPGDSGGYWGLFGVIRGYSLRFAVHLHPGALASTLQKPTESTQSAPCANGLPRTNLAYI